MPRSRALAAAQRAERRRDRKEREYPKRCYDADLRATISQCRVQGYTLKEIADGFGLSYSSVQHHAKKSMEASMKAAPIPPPAPPAPPSPVSGWSSPVAPLEEPEKDEKKEAEQKLQRTAFLLRKRAMAWGDIATVLKTDEEIIRKLVHKELIRLENNDVSDVGLLRRMHLEQLDAMMAAIMTKSTGRKANGERVAPDLQAMDRMMKLMEQKAKLLGLNAPQAVDINQRIEILALEFEYDVDELKDIARDVIQKRLGMKALSAGRTST